MKNITVIAISIFLAFLSLGLTGCYFDHHHRHHDEDTIVGSGNIKSERRTVPECSGIRIVGMAKIYLRQDSTQSITVEADDNIIDRVVTEEHGGILEAGLEDGSYNETTVNIYVSLPRIEEIEISGAGDIVGRNSIRTDELRCHIDGAGNIALEGTADVQTIVIDGAGNVSNFGLATNQTSVTINGTGKCEVKASRRFDGVINGVGSIEYDGEPEVVHSQVYGVGEIAPR